MTESLKFALINIARAAVILYSIAMFILPVYGLFIGEWDNRVFGFLTIGILWILNLIKFNKEYKLRKINDVRLVDYFSFLSMAVFIGLAILAFFHNNKEWYFHCCFVILMRFLTPLYCYVKRSYLKAKKLKNDKDK